MVDLLVSPPYYWAAFSCMASGTDIGTAATPGRRMIGSSARWALTAQAFAKLLALLDPHPDRAGEHYKRLHLKLVKFFQWHGSLFAEDHADEVINRVSRKISEGETIRDLTGYVHGVARMVLKESLKDQQKRQTRLADYTPAGPHQEASEVRVSCLERCMRRLSSNSRTLILDYYSADKQAKIDGRRQLAGRLGIPINALRIRVHRVRSKLEDCINHCVSGNDRPRDASIRPRPGDGK
jgi:DNA-directed RNA polymerase specialized sigma24 family protein